MLGNLWKKKLVTSAMCPICFQEPESIEHTFLLCEWTRSVWFGLQIQCLPNRSAISTLHDWLEGKFEEFSKEKQFKDFAISSLCYALWSIWKERNLAVFEGTKPNPLATVIRANFMHSEYFSFWRDNSGRNENQNLSALTSKVWRPPPKGMLKLNSDASFSKIRNTAHAGMIFRNDEGLIFTGLTKVFPATSPLIVEALSLREALLFAESLGISNLIVESDYLELVKACREEIKRGEIFGLVKDILNIKNRFQQLGFTWTYREGNQIAHIIAKLASQNNLPVNWVLNQPPCIRNLLQKERPICFATSELLENRSYRSQPGAGVFHVEPVDDVFSSHCRFDFPFDPGRCGELGETSGR